MLSQNTSNMDLNRQHRRQQSIPTSFEVPHMSHFLAHQQQPSGPSHRRGMSLNQPILNMQQRPQQGVHYMVSNTNTGQPLQHYLQESHQHCEARPGLQESFKQNTTTTQQEQYQTERTLPQETFRRESCQSQTLPPGRLSQQQMSQTEALSQGQTLQREVLQSAAALQLQVFRPDHPSQQESSQHETLQQQQEKILWEEEVKFKQAVEARIQSLAKNQNIVLQAPSMPPSAYGPCTQSDLPSPHVASHIPQRLPGDVAQMNFSYGVPSPMPSDRDSVDFGADYSLRSPSIHGSFPQSALQSPHLPTSPSQRRQPDECKTMNYPSYGAMSPMHSSRSSVDFGADHSQRSQRASREPQSEVDQEVELADTGISDEEVQRYISDIDPVDNKWTCMYQSNGHVCNKKFGRRENARAHVQTHLGDRQFLCTYSDCHKSFVRHHDLKRHWKIHSNMKPHTCDCGAGFARHDALTRHRQRNVCRGGLSGIVKKQAKRGRPRKSRPQDDERANRAAATRQRVNRRAQAASSVSGTSDGYQSYFSETDCSDFELEHALTQATQARQPPDMNSLQTDLYTPPMSPYGTSDVSSPQQAPSTLAEYSPQAHLDNQFYDPRVFENTFESATVAPNNLGSLASSPPELSYSSPAAPSDFLDFDMQSDQMHSGTHTNEENATDLFAPSAQESPAQGSTVRSFENEIDNDWKEDSLYWTFSSPTGDSSDDAKFTNAFNDEMLFSDTNDNQYF